MAKISIVFAILLILLGLGGYFGTGALHATALIPTWFGIALGIFGWLAMSPSESRRKLFMHVNVTIGLLGFLGGLIEIIRSSLATRRALAAAGVGSSVSYSPAFAIAMTSKVIMTGLLLIYVILCVRSFIAARRGGKV